MPIMLILLLLAITAAVCLLGGLALSILLGGILMRFPRARYFAPVFLILFPTTIAGMVAGGVGLGYMAYASNQSAILLGPLGGMLAGGGAGFLIGAAGTAFWWSRMLNSSSRSGR